MHPVVALAQQAIETYLESGENIRPPSPLPEILARPGNVFVSLHNADGSLRGCRGSVISTEPTLADAIIKTAIASAIDDPRFPPLNLAETEGLKIKVDVLSSLEPVTNINELDEKTYGVFIQSDQRRALLLPDIQAVKTVPQQLDLVRRKAGLSPSEPAQLYRFTVTRYQ